MNLHLENSYRVKKLSSIKQEVHKYYSDGHLTSARTEGSYVREWEAHNWLYRHGLFVSHTKDVDLNDDESLIRRAGFNVIYCVSLAERFFKQVFK